MYIKSRHSQNNLSISMYQTQKSSRESQFPTPSSPLKRFPAWQLPCLTPKCYIVKAQTKDTVRQQQPAKVSAQFPRPSGPTYRSQPTHSRDSSTHDNEQTAKTPNRGAGQQPNPVRERSDQPGGAPRLDAGAEGEVARLRRHGGHRHRAAAAAAAPPPARRRRWGRRGGASRQGDSRAGRGREG